MPHNEHFPRKSHSVYEHDVITRSIRNRSVHGMLPRGVHPLYLSCKNEIQYNLVTNTTLHPLLQPPAKSPRSQSSAYLDRRGTLDALRLQCSQHRLRQFHIPKRLDRRRHLLTLSERKIRCGVPGIPTGAQKHLSVNRDWRSRILLR